MSTNTDLIAVCNQVLDAKAAGTQYVAVNGITFDTMALGYCQRTAREAYEAATGGDPMPGAACCATQTRQNLLRLSLEAGDGLPEIVVTAADLPDGFDGDKLTPGDLVYFSGGPACRSCGNPVGHVGIWMPPDADGNQQMFQDTSRDGLGVTRQGPTDSQKDRFAAAFRLLKLA